MSKVLGWLQIAAATAITIQHLIDIFAHGMPVDSTTVAVASGLAAGGTAHINAPHGLYGQSHGPEPQQPPK